MMGHLTIKVSTPAERLAAARHVHSYRVASDNGWRTVLDERCSSLRHATFLVGARIEQEHPNALGGGTADREAWNLWFLLSHVYENLYQGRASGSYTWTSLSVEWDYRG